MVFRALREKAGDLYDSTVIKTKVACGLAKDMYQSVEDIINHTAREHPTLVKMAPFAPLIVYAGINMAGVASDLVLGQAAAQNVTVGDDGFGIRDGIIRFLNPDFVASGVKIYGVEGGQNPVRIAHGSYSSKNSLDFLVRDFQTDAFPKYMVETGGNVHVVTDEQLASGDGIHVIGEAAKASAGDGSGGGIGFWCGAGVFLSGMASILALMGLSKYFKHKGEESVKTDTYTPKEPLEPRF